MTYFRFVGYFSSPSTNYNMSPLSILSAVRPIFQNFDLFSKTIRQTSKRVIYKGFEIMKAKEEEHSYPRWWTFPPPPPINLFFGNEI